MLHKLLICVAVLLFVQPAAAEKTGQFEGRFIVEPLLDGRNFKLVEELIYTDPSGVRWTVPAGTITDGASVPRAAWILFPPFTGKYRVAAVVHDHFCQTRNRPWEAVHRVFYDAMLTAGVDTPTAKTMFAAVWVFGPRWLADGSLARSAAQNLPESQQQQQIRQIQQWIEENNPTVAQMEELLKRVAPN